MNEVIYDIIVVGAGHAGCEAALASARMGMKTLIITMNISNIAQMSCNPAIGGLAKGHLVRELDALGGEMAKAIDDQGIQFRMLNKSKGPAVWSLRAQADRMGYSNYMRSVLENQEGLDILQDMVVDVIYDGSVCRGVKTFIGTMFRSKAVILTTGTFLNGLIHVGMISYSAGRAGDFSAIGLTENLNKLGIVSGRLKTGTPPRIDGRTIDYDKMIIQEGDLMPEPFSFETREITNKQIPCFLTNTTEETHRILKSGLDRSPLFLGKIIGVGPRYCPSIETKIDQFSDKKSHQLYLEPEGYNTNEYYVNGFATSLPDDIQIKAIRSVPGLEKAKIMRLGYAIEYDFFPTNQITSTLETKLVPNLYLAGQINGTSGYEEAAVQGFVAGVNAVLKIRNDNPLIFDRSQCYIGVLIDDLITRDISEPYRMFTSLAEYRLLLRQDNADLRLTEYGYKLGLISQKRYEKFCKKRNLIHRAIDDFKLIRISPELVNPLLEKKNCSLLIEKESVSKLLKRPELEIADFNGLFDHEVFNSDLDISEKIKIQEQVQIAIKYEGYLSRQEDQVSRYRKVENLAIPSSFNYDDVASLSKEAREKLKRLMPRTLGQASRIAGVSPADISVLLIYVKK